MMGTLCYERKAEVWIGGGQAGSSDLFIQGLAAQLLVLSDRYILKASEGLRETGVCLNGNPIAAGTGELSAGDELCFDTEDESRAVTVRLFEGVLEVDADDGAYQTRLLAVRGRENYFPGFPHYARSPRVNYHLEEKKITIDAPPPKREMERGGLMQVIIPPVCMMAITIAMGVLMHRGPYVFMSAGMTLVTVIFSIQKFFSDRRERKEENEKREKIYGEYLLRVRKRIRAERAREREAYEYQQPSLTSIMNMIGQYSSRIYERTALDDDFLTVNLGYYEGKSKIDAAFGGKELELKEDELIDEAKGIEEEYRRVKGLPVVADLKRAHLGIVGSKANVHEQLKYLMAQITFFQSYHELQVIHIHGAEYKEEFDYMRWYPHLRLNAINVVGDITDEQARDQILGSVQQILKDRRLKLEEERQETVFLPHLLFIIDEPKLVMNHAVMEYLQDKRMNLGFSIIYTSERQASLPENIRTVCIIKDSDRGVLLLNEGRRVNREFEIQHTKGADLERSARDLSALIHEKGISSRIPESITFFEMYQIQHPEELNIGERWRKNQSHKSLAVPLGVRAQEDYVELNLHEKAHGPHGLVAGTTGSGKSEIVQSYILSLAVNFHPHEVGFLLIDYKGGGMANLFSDLPHLLGTITNLDKAESMRAMTSIKSEMSRRQRIFGECGVNHINGYNKLFKLGKVEEPLPHLFLISDEFAELKKEQPEFMAELVSAARIGRSLGIHLILATQKPSGVVDDQIWTNSKFKLCLKVQNEGDSKEMLRTPDAASITQAGRAYLQVGNNEIYEMFQSAWSGASYDREEKTEDKEDDRVYLINALGQGELINRDLSGSDESSQIKKTQLDVIVSHLKEVYTEEGAKEVIKPWLPPLGDMLVSPYTGEVRDSASFEEGDYTIGIGMIDIPEEQAQEEYVLDLIKNGHLLYMASSGYGKSVLLTNIVLGLAMKNSVRNLNFYIWDLGNSALITLSKLPHVADYMGLDDTEKIGKFQKLILEEIADRKRRFARAAAPNMHVYNQTQKEKLKAVVLVIDNYDAVRELGDSIEGFIQKVARDGAGLGIYLLVTMTRMNAMRGSVMNNFKEKICGFNFEPGENRTFVGRSDYTLSEDKKGRSLIKKENVNMMQLYLPVPCETELDYSRSLKSLIESVKEKSTETPAQGIPVLPEELFCQMLSEYPQYEESRTKLPVGIEMEDLAVQYLDISRGTGLIIGGAGSGRTNMLHGILEHINGSRVWLIDNENRTSVGFMERENISYGADYGEISAMLRDIARETETRKEDYEEAKLDDVTLTPQKYAEQEEPAYVLVDIVQSLYELLGKEGKSEEMDVLCEACRWGIYVIAASEPKIPMRSGRFMELLSESKSGIILGNIKEQRVFDYSGIREENRKAEYGYCHVNGVNKKMLVARHMS
jgi:S-DNA-T family DNA segregation ATPase FtsK/SpoIIIE